MIEASICTIGDEILIGQIVDTNSSLIASELESIGIKVTRMLSIGDDQVTIANELRNELRNSGIVIVTGGLGPTKDDITKAALAALSGSKGYVENKDQQSINTRILQSRGLDGLESNKQQAMVPDTCEVIPNEVGTAPMMVFRFQDNRFGHPATLYSLPGVPHELKEGISEVINDIRDHTPLSDIYHKSIMTFGMAESELAQTIEQWENDLPKEMHLAYLPDMLTGVRLRLSIYGGKTAREQAMVNEQLEKLKEILGNNIYSMQDDTLQDCIGRLLKTNKKTLSVAESCTGGLISALITSVPGASDYFLGSVTSYSVNIKEKVLNVPPTILNRYGVVSSLVASSMAEGVKNLTKSDYAVSTTGLAGPTGDGQNPVGTVWIGIAGPNGVTSVKRNYQNDRDVNTKRFAAAALDALRTVIERDIRNSQ
jgi:nicotinamide-nucleotide amidase